MKASHFEVCIIGLGPAGLGATLRLARSSIAEAVICLEAGVTADQKYCSILQGKGCRHVQPCQIITGVGGSSLLSGGKISVFPAGRAMSQILGSEQTTQESLSNALELFNEFVPLTSPNIPYDMVSFCTRQYALQGFEFRYYDAYLYRQADLITGYNRMLSEILAAGVSVQLGTQVTQINTVEGGFHVLCQTEDVEVEIHSKKIVLAVGRFGKELLNGINPSLHLEGQPNICDVGVRLEFPTSVWPDIDKCHNDLKLHFLNARTFCVCKDGFLAPYRVGDIFLLEGHADPDVSTGFTNLAITVRHRPGVGAEHDTLFSGIRERLLKQSNGRPVRQLLTDFLARRASQPNKAKDSSSISYWQWGNIEDCLPESVYFEVRSAVEFFVSNLIPQEAYPAVSVYAPELDYYWNRFPLEEGFQAKKPGVYLIGDCGGYFRGILQAFCSGLECATQILEVDHVQ